VVRGSVAVAVAAAAVLLTACAPDPSDAVTGAEIFAANCASCHGPDGGGNIGLPLNDSAFATKYSLGEITAIVTNGVLTMPAYGTKLSAAQIDAVIAYILGGFVDPAAAGTTAP